MTIDDLIPPAGASPPASRPVTQAVILAGGQGSRRRPYTDTPPKPMVEIPGTGLPIIGHQPERPAAEGVSDVVISCGHPAEVVLGWLGTVSLPLTVIPVGAHPRGQAVTTSPRPCPAGSRRPGPAARPGTPAPAP
ncbi:sugar phosphate nucleotidyltransferase [Nonomuraea sp. B5E05]|uniref:nucleotidyltransferase family protein n=1 Tax=Nonomuraea sp. B5E05 TaxID=3153569 RepID=UPI003260E6E7